MVERIKLAKAHVARAIAVAVERHRKAYWDRWPHHHPAQIIDYNVDLHNRELAALTECAWYVWLGGKEAGAKWYEEQTRGAPDVEYKTFLFDVKGTNYRPAWLKVPRGQPHTGWVYVLVKAVGSYEYELIGWAWWHEIRDVAPVEPLPNQPAHILREGDPLLKDVRIWKELE